MRNKVLEYVVEHTKPEILFGDCEISDSELVDEFAATLLQELQ